MLPVKDQQNISLVKSLPALFDELGLKMETPEIENFLEEQNDVLARMVELELSDWWLWGDVEDSEIHEISDTGISVLETIAFKSAEEGGSILVVGYLEVTATVHYTHPDWDTAIWDSEDNRTIVLHTVDGETETEFNIDVSISIAVNIDGDPVAIKELNIGNVEPEIILYPQYSF